MKLEDIISKFEQHTVTQDVCGILLSEPKAKLQIKGLVGSSYSFLISALFKKTSKSIVVIANDREDAAYIQNDLQTLLDENQSLYYPASYKRPYQIQETDNANILQRAEVLNALSKKERKAVIVTFPQALIEKVVTKNNLVKNTLEIKRGDKLSIDFVTDILIEYEFERVDFVSEPGQYSVRGGIIDVFSFSHEMPYRIEFFGDDIESIRSFDTASQLSEKTLHRINVIPNVQGKILTESRDNFINFLADDTFYISKNLVLTADVIDKEFSKAKEIYGLEVNTHLIKQLSPEEIYTQKDEFIRLLENRSVIEVGNTTWFDKTYHYQFEQLPQPNFNKNFELLLKNLSENTAKDWYNLIFTDSARQSERIYSIIEDLCAKDTKITKPDFITLHYSLHEGFIDKNLNIACYTDHQIFERYHRYKLKEGFQKNKQAITIKELNSLQPGDFVTHIDHGVGRYAGIEKMDVNGKTQEAIRLVYKDNDVLYVSIHSLHRISKFSGSEGTAPKLNKLGSAAWATLKQKTKSRVKDIAKDLIALYAKRKAQKGFAFHNDTYLQNELEASFIYEDTRDQLKATQDVKRDMEREYPMDRLVCGDVGFGKTEVAIRAAFKAVTDGKQVAVLVPTTILASQHYKTFSSRLKDFPCKVDYLNRFKKGGKEKETLEQLASGKTDIIIGTHRIVGKDVKFKDLGLMIIDEEQKFGVAVKEKLKSIKINVDSLTLTATPIPRTLQFSLMGSRDLSVINTPPPNRHPVQTEVHEFNEEIIRDAITYEVQRGGQVFFIHNRVGNILEVAGMIQRLCPDVRVGIGHGQMEGEKLEQVMVDFVEGETDVLVATTIIESGLDIANANTIIINRADLFGLSDLHQMRGRVGRSNKKAFCYLLTPPAMVLTPDARKRLKTIEEFAELGSGFNIAMRDLDIRGAGNLLGGEQSGFINEIGFEMYQRILDEAMQELKETDFAELYADEPKEESKFVRDCNIDTDMEVLFPDEYINSINERLILYKQLDELKQEEDLQNYRNNLIDRFGPLPHEAEELVNLIRLRWLAEKMGFEKIVMRNGKFLGYFIANQQSAFYQSDNFTKILQAVQRNKNIKLKESNNKPIMTFEGARSVSGVLELFDKIIHP